MARLEARDETYFTTVRGMCRSCRETVPARIFFRDRKVWQQSLCHRCRNEPALIAADEEWYLRAVLAGFADRSPLQGARPPRHGCPHDCGPCTWHASPCQLPVISVTNACELRCPICFTYNRADRLYHMSVAEMEAILDGIAGNVDLINVTGGEPTLHPKIIELLWCCRRPEIGRVTMNSNGLRLAEDRALCEELTELGVYVVLSFSTFDPATSIAIHGRDVVEAKLRALENLTRAGCRVTLLHVMVRGMTEEALPGIFDLMRCHENILSLTVQTMTHTGQGGRNWPRHAHIPVDEAARIVCGASGGEVAFEDFMARPAAHPLCYLVCYLIAAEGAFVPFTRLAPPAELEPLLADSYLLRPEKSGDTFRRRIDELYAEGAEEELAILRRLIDRLYPAGRVLADFERQRLAESAVRTIYVHAHMDEDTFDCARAMLCTDLVPVEPGRLIPACTYNLFYRMRDERFYVAEEGCATAEASAGQKGGIDGQRDRHGT